MKSACRLRSDAFGLFLNSFLILSLVSCAGAPTKVAPVSSSFVDDLIRNAEKRSAVSGNLLLTTEVGGHGVTTPGVLLLEYPEHLRLELQDPVGGLLGLLVVNGDRFWLYRHDRAEIVTGALRSLPGGLLPAARIDEIVGLFLARPSSEHLRGAARESDRLVYRSGSRLETILWEGGLAEPSEWRLSEAGKGGESALYEDYEFKAGLRYPTKIKIAGQDPSGARRDVTLAWKGWEPSVPKEKKLFQIPQPETFGRKIKELR